MGATQFALAISLGLQEEHRVLDVGCGSLRAGKYFIQYLLPDRYFGIEPNAHLWRTALEKEVGQDITKIKRPRFSAREDFQFDDSGVAFDCVLAQSIFSHTGFDQFEMALRVIRNQLKPDGQFLFTAIDEESSSYAKSLSGEEKKGWAYPSCVRYRRETVLAACRQTGLVAETVGWHHPRQTWYRAVLPGAPLLGPAAQALGGGRVFFNPRYK
ncbi:class I SAM-dependent methyltransferase [Amphiplicatus metriothermophilus]|uniref:Methyltransferase domain-containing protein n=1 Tax=Amphiplicatus metriothermophilus TaxID=1519374 RepID=A0A239PKV8_9PROT|nr:class I SAM-dependent methyltransferase [Amphiplicatus metriothermophilus]MBB5517216.1 cyclopropane fatty-acyl-phospholipid synthase-like methyltransferase [Amphiplicatus metriothermophilus]SNT68448.1 Methyltransferase domain-containing protein [Amphiplicatus metriothermophilus]